MNKGKKIASRKEDVRQILALKPTTTHNGLEKLYGLITKKFKLGK